MCSFGMGTVPPGRTDGRYEVADSAAGRFVTDVRCLGSQGARHRDSARPNDASRGDRSTETTRPLTVLFHVTFHAVLHAAFHGSFVVKNDVNKGVEVVHGTRYRPMLVKNVDTPPSPPE